MLQSMLGAEIYFALVTALALVVGRVVKAVIPRLPPTALPWIVIGFAFGVVFGDQLAAGADALDAARAALAGLTSGALAVAAHETAKGVLVPLVGEAVAEVVLGKLRGGK